MSRKKKGQYLEENIIQAFINLIALMVRFEITGNKTKQIETKQKSIHAASYFITNAFKLLIFILTTETSAVTS